MGDFRPPGKPADAAGDGANDDNDATILPSAIVGGRLRIERVIGEGAFGRVYLAFDTRLRRNVAIKELLSARNQTDSELYERYLDRFQREARVASTIQHTNVVTVYDLHVENNGDHYLVMEYVDGIDLRELLTQVGTLPVERAVAITLDVARALQVIHEQDVVHRDLKPANIMLTRRGTTKLTDFGIAQAGQESQRTNLVGAHPGTPLYMSPEQASGGGYLDGRSDLYSLGLVFYEMLVGEPYARRRQPLSVVRPDLSSQIVAIVHRLLAPDAASRYQSAADVIVDLQRLSSAPTRPPALPDSYQIPASPPTQVSGPPSVQPFTPAPYANTGPASADAPRYGAVTPSPAVWQPPSSGGGYAPPTGELPTFGGPAFSAPARRGSRAPVFAIVGGLLAVVLIGGIVLFAMRGGTATATATPPASGSTTPGASATTTGSLGSASVAVTPGTTVTSLGGSATPSVTLSPTTRPTATTITTPTASPIPTATIGPTPPRPGTPAPFSGPTTKWTDPKGLVTLQYPTGWTATLDAAATNGILLLRSSDGLYLYLDLYDPQQGTIAEEIQFVRTNHAKHATFTYTDGPVVDVTVGGEPAKTMSSTYVTKSNPNQTPYSNRVWAVNHAGREFYFDAQVIGTHNADVDAIIGSVSFTAIWADSAGLIKLQYPLGWSVTTDTTDSHNVLELVSTDGVFFYLDTYSPQQGTLAEEIQIVQTNHAKNTMFTYTDTGIGDARIGGEQARSLSYGYVSKADSSKIGVGQDWTVNHGGKQFFISTTIPPAHRAEIELIIASIVFVK